MLNAEQVGELIEKLVDARLSDDRATLVGLLHDLISGPRGDALNVAMVLAGVIAVDVTAADEDYHRVTVRVLSEDGEEREGCASELPPHVATFAQMIVAIANDDKAMARDLYIGYCGDDADSFRRALALLVFALNEVVHVNSDCPHCSAEEAS